MWIGSYQMYGPEIDNNTDQSTWWSTGNNQLGKIMAAIVSHQWEKFEC